MTAPRWLRASLALVLMALGLLPTPCLASEDFQPFLEGTTTGTPVGALPGPGLYLTTVLYLANSNALRGNTRTSVPLYTLQTAFTPSLLWVTGHQILGAQYAVMLTQPFAWRNESHVPGVAGTAATGTAFFNTILTPVALSWHAGGGWYVGTGLTVYLPDGTRRYADGEPTAHNFANNFWTLEPNVAASYLAHGWDFTINNVLDFNTTNPRTHYHSGDGYYADLTATRSIDRWTLGVVGNYARQFTDDTRLGRRVEPGGHRFTHVLAGPLVGYQLGPYQLLLRVLLNVRTRNDTNFSMYYFSVGLKL